MSRYQSPRLVSDAAEADMVLMRLSIICGWRAAGRTFQHSEKRAWRYPSRRLRGFWCGGGPRLGGGDRRLFLFARLFDQLVGDIVFVDVAHVAHRFLTHPRRRHPLI